MSGIKRTATAASCPEEGKNRHALGLQLRLRTGMLLVLLPGALFVFVACSSGQEPQVEQLDDGLAQAQLEVERAKAEVEQNIRTPMDEERAKQLAARHLALKQVRWGKPLSVEEDEEHFYVSYQTPQQELRLIGARVLIVDKDTEVVSPQKRR